MKRMSLTTLTDEQPARARSSHSGRAAYTVHGGHHRALHEKIVAPAKGHRLLEASGGGWEATVLALRAHVVVTTGRDTCDGTAGKLLAIPSGLYSLDALEDSAMLVAVLTDHQGVPASGIASEEAKVQP